MFRSIALVGVAVLGLALVVGTGISQGTKKTTGQIPANWKKLGLSKEQEVKIRAIAVDYTAKIRKLEMQIEDLKSQRLTDQVKVLNGEQKDKLRKLVTGEANPAPARNNDKDK